jgi:hypothetical protein
MRAIHVFVGRAVVEELALHVLCARQRRVESREE